MRHGLNIQDYPIKVVVAKSAIGVDLYSAQAIIDQIKRKENSVLIVPTGNTPIGMYRQLVIAYKHQTVDFSRVELFNLDEYYPIKKQNPDSYYYYMKTKFIDQVNLRPDHCYIPDGEAVSPKTAVENYRKIFDQIPVIDLAVIGIGPGTTCHFGFNEKGSSVDSIIRYVTLDQQTIQANRKHFSDQSAMPVGAITLGVADVLRANKIILMAKGRKKAWEINRCVNGPIGPEAPASLLRYHPRVTFIIDQKAAADLPFKNTL